VFGVYGSQIMILSRSDSGFKNLIRKYPDLVSNNYEGRAKHSLSFPSTTIFSESLFLPLHISSNFDFNIKSSFLYLLNQLLSSIQLFFHIVTNSDLANLFSHD